MKSLKSKLLLIAMAAAVGSLSGISNPVYGQTMVPAKFQQEKTDLKSDLAAVKFHRERIKFLEKKYKADKAAGREIAMANGQRELTRARGELKMAKAYVKSDKMMLVSNYNLAINSHKAAIKAANQKLAASKTRLDRDIKNGNEEAVDNDAVAVVQYQKEVNRHEAALHRERLDKNTDILAVNKEIRKANGEFAGALYAENAVASTSNLIEK